MEITATQTPTDPGERPVHRRKGRGARERVLAAAAELFTTQGIKSTGMDQLAAQAQVTKRSIYAHFASKELLVQEYLKHMDSTVQAREAALGDTARAPRERLLSVFDAMMHSQSWCSYGPTRGCPFLNAAVEIPDPQHPAHAFTTAQKLRLAERFADVAREAGASEPRRLGEQLALLYDGAAARSVVLNSTATITTARQIAETLIDQQLPGANGVSEHSGTH